MLFFHDENSRVDISYDRFYKDLSECQYIAKYVYTKSVYDVILNFCCSVFLWIQRYSVRWRFY